ncbi:MAG: GcrA cell cycle regulator [Devosiaceae bacterium]|nr:GcrA cell cycle regulator [Devosiaceae bacterium MH13]
MAWTDERVETLKTMWLAGSSASQIAAALGDVTRNAVIGKVHRLGLSGRGKPTSTAAPRARKPRTTTAATSRPRRTTTTRSAGGMTVGATALRATPNPLAAPEAEPVVRGRVDLVLVGESPRLTIQELREDTCRWPVGDPLSDDFHFCGRATQDGKTYCDYHCGVAFQAPNERRRERR